MMRWKASKQKLKEQTMSSALKRLQKIAEIKEKAEREIKELQGDDLIFEAGGMRFEWSHDEKGELLLTMESYGRSDSYERKFNEEEAREFANVMAFTATAAKILSEKASEKEEVGEIAQEAYDIAERATYEAKRYKFAVDASQLAQKIRKVLAA
jgi:hypothetical protein